ncbi:sensor histidine kinase [Pedobacter mucosus]|uniref:sensor histidine kinase n=1 Tax=Pedobacter mucosus TaxID=2895286 RepID=UPI001EE46D3F|nr:histidine kinase [Pedobacter mucosus]UKT64995.1 histidine kinase [Pedobacter mucosus]
MFRKYQIKWLFVLSLAMVIGTMLLGQNIEKAKWWYFLIHFIKVCIPITGCWMMYGYFLANNFSWLPKYPKALLSMVLGVIVSFMLAWVVDAIQPQNYLYSENVGYDTPKELYIQLSGAFFVSFLCYFVFSNSHTSTALQDTRVEKALLEQAHLRAQLISLQQQISPHFLFNSLSTLKTMVAEQAPKNYIVQLAGVYRYVLRFNDQYLSTLDDELKFIVSYLYILNERFADSLKVNIKVEPAHRELLVPSLSLQLLVENAIKHNVCSPESPLFISITSDEHNGLRVENNFQPKKSRSDRTGTGLKNIIERYKILLDRSVEISKNNGKFTVTLPLLKNEGHNNRR